MKFGTYDSQGEFRQQVVNLGITRSGQRGLFTGGMLAVPLTPEQYDTLFLLDAQSREAATQRMGFAYGVPA